jgi:hypothetical protein
MDADTRTATMKDFKRGYFLIPPLTEASLISLGLKPRDPPTPSGRPTAHTNSWRIYGMNWG